MSKPLSIVAGAALALAALAATAQAQPAAPPLILVSGYIGEEAAVHIIKQGAFDYLIKDRLGRLGRRLPTPHSFDDLVVSQEVLDVLWEVLTCVRERRRVREQWGFHGPPGVSVLFSGSPGVGKTLSATTLAIAAAGFSTLAQAQETIKVGIKLNAILLEVSVELVCAQHLGNLHQLVVVVVSVEEGLLAEDHAREHTAETPQIQ